MSIDTVQQYGGAEGYVSGAVSGLVAGIVAGGILHYGANLVELLCALAPHYGPHAVVGIGWVVHLIVSVAFALVFVSIVSSRSVAEHVTSVTDFGYVGVLFGAFFALFAAGVLYPAGMRIAGVAALPEPFVSVPGVADEFLTALVFAVGYLVYGLVLATTFALIRDAVPVGPPEHVVIRE